MCDSRSCSHSSSQEGMRLDALIKVILIANDEAPVSGKRDGGGSLKQITPLQREMGRKSLDTESRTAQVYSKEMGFISSLAPAAKLQFRQGKKAEAASEMGIPDRRGQ